MSGEQMSGSISAEALADVASSIVSQTTIEDLCADLTEKLSRFAQFERLFLILLDQSRGEVRLGGFHATTPSRFQKDFSISLQDTPAGDVIRGQVRHYIPDIDQETRYPRIMNVLREDGVRSICYLPLTSHSIRLGVLAFASIAPAPYSEDDLELLERATTPVAIAVENILNRKRLEQDRDRLKLLLEVSNALISRLDPQALFDEVSLCLQDVVPHDFISLSVWDAESHKLRLRLAASARQLSSDFHGQILRLENTPGGIAFQANASQVYDHARLLLMDDPIRVMIAERGIRSMCSLPLRSARSRIGTIGFGSTHDGAYPPEVVDVLEAIAGQLAVALENVLAYDQVADLNRRLREAKLYLEEELKEASDSEEILGRSPGIRKVLQQIETVAPTDATVLIHGETGSGKELVARAIHQKSQRTKGTFVKLNCAAIPTGLLESELFGHEKGAFTGAIAQRIGRFEIAHQGTLFLDEIGEIPLELQPKLLRVLQEKEFERLGGVRTIRSDARLVAATNRDLKQMAEANQFRGDLYYRLNVFPILVPPLRERKEDIAFLALHFTQEYSRRFGKNIASIPTDSLERLTRYHWPGNIRELQNLIERSVILTNGDTLRISQQDLPADSAPPPVSAAAAPASGTLEDVERATILRALQEAKGVIGGAKGAAARLGLKRTTLLYRMEKLGIENPMR
jgi:formate hydrogenlyase transcriptional activator